MIETEGESGSRRTTETHYSRSKQRFMSARNYYRRTADEQNTGERELEESHTLFIGFLPAFTLLYSLPTFPWFVSFPPLSWVIFLSFTSPVILPYVYSLFVSLFISIFRDTRHFSSQPCLDTRTHARTHTANITKHTHSTSGTCEDIPLTQPHTHLPHTLK